MVKTYDFGGPEKVTVTQVRSQIGQAPKARGTLRALGLHGISTSNTLPNRPEIAGMLQRVRHLVQVEPVFDSENGQNVVDMAEPDLTVESDESGVFLSFATRMKQRQADAEIHRLVAGHPSGTTLALRWDEGEGSIRQYEASPPGRPWLNVPGHGRFGLLRVDLPELSVGFEPPLDSPNEPVRVYIHCGHKAATQAVQMVEALAANGDAVNIVRKELGL